MEIAVYFTVLCATIHTLYAIKLDWWEQLSLILKYHLEVYGA